MSCMPSKTFLVVMSIFTLIGAASVPAVMAQTMNPPVTREWQGWADANRNGMLEPREVEDLLAAAIRLFEGPHNVANPLDGMFDANHDGRITKEEIDPARAVLVRNQLAKAPQSAVEIMPLIDLNGDGRIDDVEITTVIENLFIMASTRNPHPVSSPFDRKMDMNHDNKTGGDEFITYRNNILRTTLLMPPADFRPQAQGGQPVNPLQPQRVVIDTGREPVTQQGTSPGTVQTTVQGAVATTQTAAAASTGTAQTATAATGKKVTLDNVKISEIFPVFRSYYDDHPIGTATLSNGESAAMENIKIDLELKGYMDAKKPCKAPTSLAAGAEGQVEFNAVFNDSVLKITEGTKALATITVSFTIGEKTFTNESVQTVTFLKINAMTWDDDQRAAAFVTANDPLVQQLRSSVVTNVDKASSAIDLKLRTAMALYQELVKYGIKYWSDPNAAYATMSQSDTIIDTLQFPVQTLQLKTGDCDDLSILVSAILESASVETAFITVPGHIYVAFALSMTQAQAKSGFLNPENLIYQNDKAWIPWEITELSGSFLKAWETGAKEWREADTKKLANFYPVHTAWTKYKPVAYSSGITSLTLPAESDWVKVFTDEVKTFINREIATRVSALQAEIKKAQGQPEPVNRLGVLYAKYGLMAEAKAQFALLDAKDYAPALVNLGNIAFLAGDSKTALTYYSRAVKKDPTSTLALLGFARASHELENYGDVQTAYAKLKTLDAALASQYAYLELKGTEAARAASAGQVTGTAEWDDGT